MQFHKQVLERATLIVHVQKARSRGETGETFFLPYLSARGLLLGVPRCFMVYGVCGTHRMHKSTQSLSRASSWYMSPSLSDSPTLIALRLWFLGSGPQTSRVSITCTLHRPPESESLQKDPGSLCCNKPSR